MQVNGPAAGVQPKARHQVLEDGSRIHPGRAAAVGRRYQHLAEQVRQRPAAFGDPLQLLGGLGVEVRAGGVEQVFQAGDDRRQAAANLVVSQLAQLLLPVLRLPVQAERLLQIVIATA